LKLARSFQILEADRSLTLYLGLTHFLVAASHSFFDIGSTALLIAHLGPDTLPQVYMVGAILLIFVGLVIIPVVDRLDRSKLFSFILVLFAVILLGGSRLAGTAPDLSYRGLYIACFLMKSLVFLQFWLLAGDLLDIRQAKRLFPVLLGCSLVGGVTASLTASLLPRWLDTEAFLAVAGMLLLVTLIPVRIISRKFRRHRTPTPQAGGHNLGTIWRGLRSDIALSIRTPLLRTLSLFLLLLALLAQVLDFLLGKAAHVHFTAAAGGVDLDALTTFYAVLNGAVIGAGVLVQLLAANRVISSVGITRGELLAPITFVGAFAATGGVWLAGGGMTAEFFFAVVASRAIQKVLRISLVRTSTDLIYNAIPSERRGRAKAFKETVIEPLGVLLGGLCLLGATALPLQYVLGCSLLISVFFLASTFELKSRYVDSLVRILKEKSRFQFAFPSIVMRKASALEPASVGVSGLRRALADEESAVRILAAEVAAELREPEAANLLVDRFREEPDADVRAHMLGALGKMIHKGDGGVEVDPLAEVDPLVRASGMESIAQSGIFRPEEVPEGAATRPEALATDDLPPGRVAEDTGDGSGAPVTERGGDERRRVFHDLAHRGDRSGLERLVHHLEEGDGATRHLAARALESCGESAVDVLTIALWSTDVEGRRSVIGALDRIGTPRARQALLPVLSLEAEEAYYDLVRLNAIQQLGKGPGVELLADSMEQRVARARRNAHQVLRAVFLTEPGMRLILSNLNHPDRYVRSSAIEALELRVEPALLGGILPLFEHENPRSIAEHGGSYFSLPSRMPAEVLRELARHRSPWIRACALYAMGQVAAGELDELACLRAALDDSYQLARLNAVEALGRIGDRATLAALGARPRGDDPKMTAYVESAMAAIRSRTERAAG
jgi:HEAT repeat protein/ATP/ADP translocase